MFYLISDPTFSKVQKYLILLPPTPTTLTLIQKDVSVLYNDFWTCFFVNIFYLCYLHAKVDHFSCCENSSKQNKPNIYIYLDTQRDGDIAME